MSSYYLRKTRDFLELPFSVQWRAGLVRLPWLVPQTILHITASEGPYPTEESIEGRHGDIIYINVFYPSEPPPTSAGYPIHLDFHGGGFIMGSCLEQAPWCGMVARKAGRIALTVNYRKGPLDKFPAAIEDAEDVLAAILDTKERTRAGQHLRQRMAHFLSNRPSSNNIASPFDPTNISLSGFSSGGNLALNLVLSVEHDSEPWPSLLNQSGKLIPTLLFFPSFDSTLLPHERPRPKKMAANTSGWFASIGSVLGPTYLPEPMRTHPRASPGLNDMKRSLCDRSHILLVLPEIDTLASQSEEWINKMKAQGLEDRLTICREEDMVHGWTQFPDLWLDKKALERKYAVLNRAIDFLRQITELPPV